MQIGRQAGVGASGDSWQELGNHFTSAAPVCQRCLRQLRARRWMRRLLMPAVALMVFCVLDPSLLNLLPRPIRRWSVLTAMLICLAPVLAWELFARPGFRVSAVGDSVRYQFSNRDYAQVFARLNNAVDQLELDTDE